MTPGATIGKNNGKTAAYNRSHEAVAGGRQETPMNEETLNLSIRKFLKMVGIHSQREIEQAIARALAESRIKGRESFPAKMTLAVPGLDIDVKFDGEIKLE